MSGRPVCIGPSVVLALFALEWPEVGGVSMGAEAGLLEEELIVRLFGRFWSLLGGLFGAG
jgi:hypothetical protein